MEISNRSRITFDLRRIDPLFRFLFKNFSSLLPFSVRKVVAADRKNLSAVLGSSNFFVRIY